MKTMLVLSFTVALTVLSSAVLAYPTLAGPSGLVAVPTAEVAPAGQLQLAADFYATQDKANDVNDAVPIRVLYGIAPNWEVGAAGWIARVGGQEAGSLAANVKFHAPVTLLGSDLAAGAIFAVTKQAADDGFSKDADTWEVYLAGTRALINPIGCLPLVKGTLGVNWTKIDAGMEKGDAFRVAGGLEIVPINCVSVIAELQSKRTNVGDDRALSSIALRVAITRALQVEAGSTNAGFNYAGLTGAPEHHFFAGLNYAWGGEEK